MVAVEQLCTCLMFTFGWKVEHDFVEFSRWAVDKKRKSFQNENHGFPPNLKKNIAEVIQVEW